MSTFKNEIGIASNAIQINIYTRNFDYELYKSYKDNYEANKDKLLSFQELIEAKKTYFWLKIITYPYTENEKKMLLLSYTTIDKGYSALESSLKLMKVCLDMYKDSL